MMTHLGIHVKMDKDTGTKVCWCGGHQSQTQKHKQPGADVFSANLCPCTFSANNLNESLVMVVYPSPATT